MIQLDGIVKTYHSQSGTVPALRGVTLSVKEGEIFGIIGKSGAGKSTLIRCINMLERPSAGTVMVGGQNITELNETGLRKARKKIGMIFQHFNLLSSRTVFENVAFPLELAGYDKAHIQQTVTRLLTLVGLAEKHDQYPSQLSGGQKQRVGIARALANQPKVLLCDEATSALDPQTTKSILELLKTINQELKLTIVLITHEMHVIKEICDQVAVMENGVIIEQGAILDIFTKPQATTTREFIATIMNHDLPERFRNTAFSAHASDNSNAIIRLSFIGVTAEEPIIAGLIRRFDIDASILYGNIDHIKNTSFGTLILELSGRQAAMNNALDYLKSQDLGIEVIGYVPGHAKTAV